MSTQYRLVQSGKTASGGCSAGQGSSEPVAPRIYFYFIPRSMTLQIDEHVTGCMKVTKELIKTDTERLL
jgi:carbohydrate-binding DOMON domain-containing protein